MALFDKLNQVAKNLGDKTSDVIETTRLNGKLASEKLAANEELLKIGQFYYDRYLMGQAEADIIGYCEAAKAQRIENLYDNIAIDNPAIKLFLKVGFYEEYRTDEIIMLRKDL